MILTIKKSFDKIVDWVSIFLMVVLTYVSFHQVVVRTFGHPAEWTEELSRYLFIWVSFLGAAIAFRFGAHLGVDFLVKLLPTPVQRFISIIINLMMLITIGVMFWVSLGIVSDTTQQWSPILRLPMNYPYLAIPVGLGLMFIEVAWNFVVDMSNSKTLRYSEVRNSVEEI